MQENTRTYQVESSREKNRRFTVVLEPMQFGFKAECDCVEYLSYGHWCDHIEHAVSCYRHGL